MSAQVLGQADSDSVTELDMQESLGEKPVKDTGRWGRRRRRLCWSASEGAGIG